MPTLTIENGLFICKVIGKGDAFNERNNIQMIREKFGYLKEMDKEQFLAQCNSTAQIGNIGDISWTDSHRNMPCMVVGELHGVISTSFYIVYWDDRDDKLCIGQYCSLGEPIVGVGDYYCTNALVF